MSMFSLTVKGTPCSGPTVSPAFNRRSAKAAAARASSARTRTMAFNAGFTASMRARCASTTSAVLSSRRNAACHFRC
jgi:hypothetical protein